MHRPPLSKRNNPQQIEEYFELQEELSLPLKLSLLEYVSSYFRSEDILRQFERRNDLVLPRNRSDMLEVLRKNDSVLLDAVDYLLGEHYDWEEVKGFLDDSRSIYDVGRDEQGRFQLHRRQPPELSVLVETALTSRGRAYDHLRRAVSYAFGRDSQPNDACFESTKALEVVAKPILTPNDQKATLGRMIAAVEAKPSKWITDFDANDHQDINSVVEMLKLVWETQLRHGDTDDPLEVPPKRAEMIVHLAVLLVHWFSSGRIRTSTQQTV
ncbi:MAG: hypothetical protein F4Y28_07175 [Acidimicrobiia bacterium]|nr:hypothetical protein [Acidimicrobiia bacterium]MYG58040.1 hypothetical protein [Acidimicrobiia bacterium]MYJ32529.1 hypothetical protein [Acidimicrobiia bacterium]